MLGAYLRTIEPSISIVLACKGQQHWEAAAIFSTSIALARSPESAGASCMKRIILCLSFFGCLIAGASARDLRQWGGSDPAIRQWYQALMQPDVPHASCCREADAYWADEVHARTGKTYTTITDDRPDCPRK